MKVNSADPHFKPLFPTVLLIATIAAFTFNSLIQPLFQKVVQSHKIDPKTGKPYCTPLGERPLRVGITPWAGFAGGLLVNGGMNSNGEDPQKWEFQYIDKYRDRADSLSGCAADDKHVDVLWSSVESWPAEFPKLGDKAQAIMEIGESSRTCGIVTDSQADLNHLLKDNLAVAKFSPAHWVAIQSVQDLKVIQPLDSSQEALDEFVEHKVHAVALCEPYLTQAVQRGFKRESSVSITFIMLARKDAIRERPELLKQFLRAWLQGNKELINSHHLAVDLLLQEREAIDDETDEMQLRERVEGELEAAGEPAAFEDNIALLGTGKSTGAFDANYQNASLRWRDAGIGVFQPKVARNNGLLVTLDPSVEGHDELCSPTAKTAEAYHATLLFGESGSKRIAAGPKELESIAKEIKIYLEPKYVGPQYEAQACIVGYTDSRGEDRFNATLSLERATAVRNYLQAYKILDSKLSISGRGARDPVASNLTLEGQALNRRTEIRVVVEEGQ